MDLEQIDRFLIKRDILKNLFSYFPNVWFSKFLVAPKTMFCRISLSCLKKNGSYLNGVKSQVARYSSKKADHVHLAYTVFDPPTPTSPSDVNCPLLIASGLLCSRQDWTSIANEISRQINIRVITVDPRNHGDSQHAPEHSHVHMADDICNLLGDLNLKTCMLMGHSMGGTTSMAFALKYQSLLEKLIVVDVSPLRAGERYPKLKNYVRVLREVQIKYEGSGKSYSEVRQAAEEALMPVAEPGPRAILLNNLASQNGEVIWKPNLQVLLDTFDIQGTFPEEMLTATYEGPTLFIRGQFSSFIPPADHPGIMKTFPAAKIVSVDNAGHLPQVDNVVHFLQLLLPFLKGDKN